ncbi:MAG TPA: TSUP family transporter, partial [Flavipsychrobacter sp.]|nr:TSUP family transporter [Flavipsychrobacter sp.]
MLEVLCLFAFLAGFIDAMVGGGGLIQLPAFFLLMPQLSLVQTLASNKTASFFGTTVATVRYLRKVKIDWKHLSVCIAAALVGSLGGAMCVSYIRKEQFMPFIITALVLVLLYTLFKKELGLHHTQKQLSKTKYYLYALGTGGIIGFYDGLIGPGTGSFLIFAFVVLFGYNFLHASANAKLINCVTNLSALSFFFVKGHIVWSIALPVAAANMLGNYVGAQYALKKGSAFIR